jgi:ectoine hydroxylase-related dioxygenase (phytanoyl-CoA dioxygenase family)
MQAELHPWNSGFEWQPAPAPTHCISPQQAAEFDEQGFLLIEDAFDRESMQAVIAEIDPWEERVTEFLRTQDEGRLFIAQADAITFSTHLVTRSPALRDFCAGPRFRDLCADLIGPDVRLYWDQAVYKKTEKRRSFPWHQDNGYTFVMPQQYLTCWVALTDTNEDNGCPWVVPGAHRRGTFRHWMTDLGWQCLDDPPNARPVPARAGSIVVFSSLTPHATGPNRTDAVRKAYIVQFAPDGAHILKKNPAGGDPLREPQDAADRQFHVLRGGQGVD